MPTLQQFHAGDHVRVADDLGAFMSHFESGCEAIVIGSYADQYGGTNQDSYTLFLEGRGRCSWYYGSQLTLLAHGRHDLLEAWQTAQEERRARLSDLAWIFEHGPDVLANPSGASIIGLAATLGLSEADLWGNHGEGMTFYARGCAVLDKAAPFLEQRDREGWVAYAQALRASE